MPEEAWLEWSAEGETKSHRVAMPVAPGKDPKPGAVGDTRARDYEIIQPRMAQTITYRVVSGSVTSPQFKVTVVEPPAVARVAARVEPPEYTKLPATNIPDASRILAFEGSRVTLDIEATRPVRLIEVEWPGGPSETSESVKAAASRGPLGRTGSVTVEARKSGPVAVSLRDPLGIASRRDQPRRVVVRADLPPVVAVRGPDGITDIGPGDTLGLLIVASDDIAIASVELHYGIERVDSAQGEVETGHAAVSLKGMGSRSARGEAALALSPLKLKPGDSLTYRVRVADNRPAPRGPNVVWSTPQTLTIVAAAEPLRVRASRARTSGLVSKFETLRKEVVAERQKTEQLRQAAEAVRRGDGEWDEERGRALLEREAGARTIEDQLKLLARELAADRGLGALSRPLAQVAEVEAEAARAALEAARPRGGPLQRGIRHRACGGGGWPRSATDSTTSQTSLRRPARRGPKSVG